MKNTFGNHVSVTLFGESHGVGIGAVLDGLAPGIPVDEDDIRHQLALRRAGGKLSTARQESDPFVIESGVWNGVTTGTPIAIVIPNESQHSRDYAALRGKARPGHADYTAFCKYHGYEDYRGGGHFSGRITAALVAAGTIARGALREKGILIGTHLSRCAGVDDRAFDEADLEGDLDFLADATFPVLDEQAAQAMQDNILAAKSEGDSVGGVLETLVLGVPAGVGEPWFDTVESLLSHALFGIPAVKGVEFGDGFALCDMRGSAANDPFTAEEDGSLSTVTNRNGGINGGITNGMPLRFRCAIKPTPSIYKAQQTADFLTGENVELEIAGRHDPCIAHRARAVVDAVTALVLCDMLTGRYGTDWLAE